MQKSVFVTFQEIPLQSLVAGISCKESGSTQVAFPTFCFTKLGLLLRAAQIVFPHSVDKLKLPKEFHGLINAISKRYYE